MMRACEAWLVERSVPKLNVMVRDDNAAARGFYSSPGFTRSPELNDPPSRSLPLRVLREPAAQGVQLPH